nr:MAG TPA: hypothetical protein [Caudoviricetes sp.]
MNFSSLNIVLLLFFYRFILRVDNRIDLNIPLKAR